MWSKWKNAFIENYSYTYLIGVALVLLGFFAYSWMLDFTAVSNQNHAFPHVFLVSYLSLAAGLIWLLSRVNLAHKNLNQKNQQLADREDRLIEAQTIAKIGSWYFEPGTERARWTKEMFSIFDFDIREGEPSIDDIKSRVHPEDLPLVENLFKRVLSDGKPFVEIYRVVRKDGKIGWVEMRSEPVWNGCLQVIAAQGTCQDISEKTELEAEVRRQQAITYHQSKLAAIGQLAAGVGHEINNPLAIIDGNALRIESKHKNGSLTDKELNEYVAKIRVSVERIKNITTGLTTFSRSDTDNKSLTSLKEATIQSMNMLREIYKNDEIKLIYQDDGQPDEAYLTDGNYGRLQQVIMNLVGNARDASKGRKNSEVKVYLEAKPSEVLLVVEDNGAGIDKNIQEEIFNPFFTTKSVNEGTGLGLSIVSAIVKDHRGEIDLKSAPEKGTRFIIKLPKAS